MTNDLFHRPLDCFATDPDDSRPIHVVRQAAWPVFLTTLPTEQAAYLTDIDFKAEAGSLALIPGATGVEGAIIGVADAVTPECFGNLAQSLPATSSWYFKPGDYDAQTAAIGFCLGAYRYIGRPPKKPQAKIVPPADDAAIRSIISAVWWARDLVNKPANQLGPEELANAAIELARACGATHNVISGAELHKHYPAVHAVGEGSERPPRVVTLEWTGAADGPLISLCGKGVCFDTGGYDIKPSSGMLKMKKDMGGAAIALGVARLVMEAKLPVRLKVRIGCVENSVSGHAMRPGDILNTRRGLTVEVGNTDAEGRLVLCDLLAEASDEKPHLLLDFATLTGAARVALGPELPAFFCDDDELADSFQKAGESAHDPVWRLPLWAGYDQWLKSPVADLNNVSSKTHAGAITAGLFLKRFVQAGTPWIHVDTYAWSDQNRAGHPEGGDSQALRAAFRLIVGQIPLYATR